MTTMPTAPTSHPTPRGHRPAVVSAVAAVGFVVLVILAGLLDPGYSQISEAISALASTESHSAPAMIAGFGLLGLSALAAGIALWRSLRGGLARSAVILVLLAGVATLAEGYFRQTCSSLQQSCLDAEAAGNVSSAHVLHNLIALPLFTMLVVAAFLLAFAARRTPALRHLWLPTLGGAVLAVIFFVWFGSGAYGSFGGLVQRGLVLLCYGIPLAIGLAATRPASVRRHFDDEADSQAALVSRY